MKEINLTNGGVTIVSECDYEYLSQWNWYRNDKGYALRCKGGKKMHRIILNAQDGEIVDHKNRIKLDNTRDNIHITTAYQNAQNQPSRKSFNKKYKGVDKTSANGGWQSRCRMFGQSHHLGVYNTEKAAAYAYNKKVIELNPTAYINELDESIEELEAMLKRDIIHPRILGRVSKYPNVYFLKDSKVPKWFVSFKINGENKYFGRFSNEEDAYKKVLEVSERFGYKLSKGKPKI
jgi:hypothetical protein